MKNIWRSRDEALDSVLSGYVAQTSLLPHLTFQGGGALHFIYGSPRYSTDLDFVAPNLRTQHDALMTSLQRGVRIGSECVVPTIKSDLEGLGHVKASYRLPSGFTVKSEIVGVPSQSRIEARGKYSPLGVETPGEVYVDKLVATLARLRQRGSFKPTDLFDLNWISRNFSLPDREDISEQVREKLGTYNQTDIVLSSATQEAQKIIRATRIDSLVPTLERTLLPDVFREMTFDQSYLDEAVTHFERLA